MLKLLFKATLRQGEFFLWLIYFVHQFPDPKRWKSVSLFCHIQLQWKVVKRFQKIILKMWSVCTKIALGEKKYGKIKNLHTRFCFWYLVSVATVKIRGQSGNYPLSLPLWSVRFKWKIAHVNYVRTEKMLRGLDHKVCLLCCNTP